MSLSLITSESHGILYIFVAKALLLPNGENL
jgi:hypothetical protein